eukprot:SAG22_NODE_202_length_15324_cov_7.802627_4_plen_502_part_00
MLCLRQAGFIDTGGDPEGRCLQLQPQGPSAEAPALLAAVRQEWAARGDVAQASAVEPTAGQPEPVPAPAPAPEPLQPRPPVGAPLFLTAGTPVPIDRWRRRYTQPCNRRPAAAGPQQVEGLADLFGGEAALAAFLRSDFGQRPVILQVDPAAAVAGGAGGAAAPDSWPDAAAALAAAAARAEGPVEPGQPRSGGGGGGGLVVVNPADVERKTPDPLAAAALAHKASADPAALAAALAGLSHERLLAVRDPHRLADDEGGRAARLVAAVQRAFAAHFDCPVSTNLYMNAPGAAGFVEHHDPHEVFALQLSGCKRWRVGPPLLQFGSHRYRWRDSEVSDPEALDEFVVRPGQCLYIPIGWRHKAEPTLDAEAGGVGGRGKGGGGGGGGGSTSTGESAGGPSVHLTMGVQLPRWADAIESLVHELGAELTWLREPLPAELMPPPPPPPDAGVAGSEFKHVVRCEELASRLERLAAVVRERGGGGDRLQSAGLGGGGKFEISNKQ